jgi:hypothetical protein
MTRVNTNSLHSRCHTMITNVIPVSLLGLLGPKNAGVHYRSGISETGPLIPFKLLSNRPSFFTIKISNAYKGAGQVGYGNLETN